MTSFPRPLAAAAAFFAPAVAAVAAAPAVEPVDFNRDIRPILSNKCYACHGPDAEERKGGNKETGGLRLDTRDGALEDLGGYAAIVLGNPDESELIIRVEATDDDVMPPTKHSAPLKPAEIALLRRWVAEGAKYARHWSYEPPVRAALPPVKDAAWGKTDIDRFILARLESEGLAPSPEADRYALARRVSLDLTGLPPSVEAADRFANDASPDAYEKFVDGLLKSPAYGERWARVWLDLARYADSAGYADDPPRTIWGYRDWVIRAINDNKPFDQFTIEQIAGDLLESPTTEQLVATAFHRNTMTNNEGGTSDEEFRNVAVVDRVNTTLEAWMGTTMACAQCHTHKYDPITQEEYFEVFAIFNNTQDADRKDESPTVGLETGAQQAERAALEQKVAAMEKALAEPTPEFLAAMEKWAAQNAAGGAPWKTLPAEKAAAQSGAALVALPDGSLVASGKAAGSDVYEIAFRAPEGKPMTALRIEALPHESLAGGGPGRTANGNFVLNEIELSTAAGSPAPRGRFVRVELPGKEKPLHLAEVEVFSGGENVARGGKASQSSTDFGGPAERAIDGNTDGDYQKNSVSHTALEDDPWWEVDLGAEKPIDRLAIWNRTDNNLQSRLDGFRLIVLNAKREPVWTESYAKAPQREQVASLTGARHIPLQNASASYAQPNFGAEKALDGDAGKDSGWAVGPRFGVAHEWVAEIASAPEPGSLLTLTLRQTYPDHPLGRFRISATPAAAPVRALPAEIAAALAKKSGDWSEAERKALVDYYAQIDPATAAKKAELAALKKEAEKVKPSTTVPVMRELPENQRRKTHVQIRGNFQQLGDEVQPGFPNDIFKFEGEGTPDRLDFARWLVDRRNPLTARVAVNRYWEQLFGIGLVRTSEEFGNQGEPPSHPALLDWLGVVFMDSGWDAKALLKLIVTSAAYRQSSASTAALNENDPDNRLLARGPRFRLSAEMIRDQALSPPACSATKCDAPAGPAAAPETRSARRLRRIDRLGDEQRRGPLPARHLHQLAPLDPLPVHGDLDAPSREVCTSRRIRTNTPLQALVTLNDPAFVEAAQALARQSVANAGPSDAERAAFAFRQCATRPPTDAEVQRLVALLAKAKERFASDPDAAAKMATDLLGPAPNGADLADLAAWTVVGNVLLNLDEVLMKR
ncbi:MAG: DUF1549 domain-containing protein [Verrucomicrobiales bacterium]